MATLELVNVAVDDNGFKQEPRDAIDLDGYREVSIYVTNGGLSFSGGGTTSTPFRVSIYEAARNRVDDYAPLATYDFVSSGSPSKLDYQSQFARFLRGEAEWIGAAAGDSNLEILLVPKR